MVFSRASGRELELEPDLLHPLASGSDVDRYAFRALTDVLLFPYVRDGDTMRLATPAELDALPLTRAYLAEHEALLRGRERGRMDHDQWYAYVYPKSLGHHDRPKLGVAATVRRLEVAADLDGAIYFHKVRVNGVLASGAIPLTTLLPILDSRLLDWIFRRGSADHANDYFAANKQFIAGLPIQLLTGSDAVELDALGERLYQTARAIASERGAFLRWLAATFGVSPALVARRREIAGYDSVAVERVVDALARIPQELDPDPRERSVRELVEREHRGSVDRLVPLLGELARAEREADDRVFDLYQLPAAMRALVDGEYD